jgi:hypothetical protein
MAAVIVKPSMPPHHGSATNAKSFASVYSAVKQHPGKLYSTAGNGTPFKVTAQIATRGKNNGKKVLIFRTNAGVERARAYRCCWNRQTNCNRAWIDCYIKQL